MYLILVATLYHLLRVLNSRTILDCQVLSLLRPHAHAKKLIVEQSYVMRESWKLEQVGPSKYNGPFIPVFQYH
ncbi:hypothetical protein N657DRAFT_445789 [Parathielavia appendiculata]|uniref:Uncharacterized protein n=1 Tax=Parathielavia appendiculata TaxID=2587402 RepID=A0AAN6Z2D4_9PEZI|nr:hypothetical protein N657DRAFT_445789 [Parathielavia appendiculata]